MTTNPTPNRASPRYTHAQRQLLNEAHDTDQQIAMYREMLTVARRYDHDFEIDRVTRCEREWHAEMDDIIERAIDLGLEPEDFDQPIESTDHSRPASRLRTGNVITWDFPGSSDHLGDVEIVDVRPTDSAEQPPLMQLILRDVNGRYHHRKVTTSVTFHLRERLQHRPPVRAVIGGRTVDVAPFVTGTSQPRVALTVTIHGATEHVNFTPDDARDLARRLDDAADAAARSTSTSTATHEDPT